MFWIKSRCCFTSKLDIFNCSVKSALKGTKPFSHKHATWSDEEFTGRKNCFSWLLKKPFFSGAIVSISSRWISSNEIIIHMFFLAQYSPYPSSTALHFHCSHDERLQTAWQDWFWWCEWWCMDIALCCLTTRHTIQIGLFELITVDYKWIVGRGKKNVLFGSSFVCWFSNCVLKVNDWSRQTCWAAECLTVGLQMPSWGVRVERLCLLMGRPVFRSVQCAHHTYHYVTV